MKMLLASNRRVSIMSFYSAVIASWESSLKVSDDRYNGSYELSGVRGCVVLRLDVSNTNIFFLRVLRLADEKIVTIAIQGSEDRRIGAPELSTAGILPINGKYPSEPLDGIRRFLIDVALHLEIIFENNNYKNFSFSGGVRRC